MCLYFIFNFLILARNSLLITYNVNYRHVYADNYIITSLRCSSNVDPDLLSWFSFLIIAFLAYPTKNQSLFYVPSHSIFYGS
jgi:hypothetical protein